MALFLAWREESQSKIEFQRKLENRKPNLVARYEQAYFYRPYPLLIVLMQFTNAGEIQSAATDLK
jgi:hypothetical protein